MSSFWTQERIGLLKRLYEQNLSGTQIAAEITAACGLPVTRNAVIGALHRRGMTGREKPATPPKPRPPAKRRVRFRVVERTAAPMMPTEAVSLHDLTSESCRFPFGDGPFTFCGCPAVEGRPYCEAHIQVCYERDRPTRDERRAANLQRERDQLKIIRSGFASWSQPTSRGEGNGVRRFSAR